MNALQALTENSEVLRVGWTLLHFLWQGAVVALLLGVVLLALRSHGPLARYIAASIGMAVLTATPLITFYSLTEVAVTDTVAVRVTTVSPRQTGGELNDTNSNTDPALASISISEAPPSFGVTLHGFLSPIVPWCAVLWFIGSCAMALRLMGGLIQAERIKRYRVTVLDGEWTKRMAQIGARVGVSTPVLLLESALVSSPMVIGYFKPVVLLPIAALVGLTAEQLDAILAHELAHVRRRDYWVQLVQRVVEAALFYHPAVWWVSRQIDIEREHCCDDLAAEVCGGSLPYAQALTGLAQLNVRAPAYGLSAAGGSLLKRIHRLLSSPTPSRRHIAWWPGGLAATVVIVAIAFGMLLNGRVAANTRVVSQLNLSVDTPAQVAPRPATRSEVPGVAFVDLSRAGDDPVPSADGLQLMELVRDHLSVAPSIRLVDRDTLDRSLHELRLQHSGLADTATAGRIGSVVGARYFVSGRLMTVNDDWVCTLNCVDTQTTEIGASRVSADPGGGVVPFAEKIAAAVTDRVSRMASRSVTDESSDAALDELRASLAGKVLPTVAVAIPESHIGEWTPDPAAENEIISVLTQAGYRVVDVKTFLGRDQGSSGVNLPVGQNSQKGTVRAGMEGGARDPRGLLEDKEIAKVREVADVFIVGEAFSESAGEQSGFKSCTARVELKALDTKTESVLLASSEHTVAAEVSDLVAGKKALRECGHALGVMIARELATKWSKTAPLAPAQEQNP